MDNKKIKILIVDDDETIRGIYTEVFKKEGFEVVEATDGVEGLDKATKELPKVILTGIIMPRMDGFGLKEALEKNVNTANIPVMMISHMGREEDRQKAMSMGIKDFFIQGMISPRGIADKIKAMFGSSEYRLNLCVGELDADRLAQNLHLNKKLECSKCREKMILVLKVKDVIKKEFEAKMICPKCNVC